MKEAKSEEDLKAALQNYYNKISDIFTMTEAEKNAWSVIGGICGSNWDKDFPMTEKEAGIFESEALELKAGEELKCRQGASWDVNIGVNGENFKVEADGTYIVHLDVANETIELIAQ